MKGAVKLKSKFNHSDCYNFIPVDVAKGLCSVHNKEIIIEGDICPDFEILPKCKHCSNFSEPDEKDMGTCLGFPDKGWVFGELKATTCEKYTV